MSITPSTGLASLDAALGGLMWGDNVVWESGTADALRPFVRSAAATRPAYAAAAWVAFRPETSTPEGFERLDAAPPAALANPSALAADLRRRCSAEPRQLVIVDDLRLLAATVGVDAAARFFVQTCPLLLDLGAVAHWQLTSGHAESTLRRRLAEVTQCILTVGEGALTIAKAEGRPTGVEGTVFRYHVDDDRAVLAEAPAASRLSGGLRAVRLERHLSQAALARIAGVSPSAISQAERGERGLSLETLLTLTGHLGLSLDELLRGGGTTPGYRIARRDPRHPSGEVFVPLLDDPRAGLRVILVRLPAGAEAAPTLVHKGNEVVAVAEGLVQVGLAGGGPVLRQGEALAADATGVRRFRNLADREALAFWILRDP